MCVTLLTIVVIKEKYVSPLNVELTKHKENTLSDIILNGRILSSLGKEYDNF